MIMLRRASRGSVQVVVCLWLCAAVFFCMLLKSESLAFWSCSQALRSRSVLPPARRLSNLPRGCDPSADALRSALLDAGAGDSAPAGDAPEGSSAEPDADAGAAATVRKGVQDFKLGEIIDGKVKNQGKGTVWVDIGIPKGAKLLGRWRDKFRLESGEKLKGLCVDKLDIEKGLIWVRLPDLESRVKDRQSNYKPPRNKTEASSTDQAQSETAGGGSPKADSKTATISVGGNVGATQIGLGNAKTLELTIAGVGVSKLVVDRETGRISIGLGGAKEAAAQP
eukprot:TRINITY_DN252_c0_g1_i2.p1 TRINITY_DN252_c0_g1~~TRINITY_DN252_c0_g1_i2.p1  ORF type:complete len:281 (-),score=53.51 TRINITY_DN252_c0_g1_i2:13-855(-)